MSEGFKIHMMKCNAVIMPDAEDYTLTSPCVVSVSKQRDKDGSFLSNKYINTTRFRLLS